jgi:hypothetical protein
MTEVSQDAEEKIVLKLRNHTEMTREEKSSALAELQRVAREKYGGYLTSAEIGTKIGCSESWVRKYMPKDFVARPRQARYESHNPQVRRKDPSLAKEIGTMICPECKVTLTVFHLGSGHAVSRQPRNQT